MTPAIIHRSDGVMPSTLPKRAASRLRVKRRWRLMAATPMAKLTGGHDADGSIGP